MKLKSEHWLEMAEAFGTPFAERTERQKDITRNGLCYAVSRFNYEFRKDVETIGYKMGFWGFWPFDRGERSDEQRCLFALLMWAIGEEEFERLVE